MKRTLSCGLAVALLCSLSLAADGENLLTDPGFENVRKGKFSYWQVPSSWSGKLTAVSEKGAAKSGRHCAKLETAERKGQFWGRLYNSRPLRVTPDARYKVAVWARGQGVLSVGCLEYGRDGEKRRFSYPGMDDAEPLGEEWREYAFAYRRTDPTAYRIVMFVHVKGKGAHALLDDAFFAPEPEPGYDLSVSPGHTMAKPGGSVDFAMNVKTPPDGAEIAVKAAPLADKDAGLTDTVRATGTARVAWTWKPTAETASGVWRFAFVLDKAGIARETWVDLVPPAVYEEFARAAEAAEVATPARLVFVGDSLTAQKKGYNYVDKVRGWLDAKYGDKVKVFNAGVGGDNIGRVARRLQADVLDLKPTRVFIFLGHNDSKLSSVSNYERSAVSPEAFEKLYRETIERIKKETGAAVTVMSATSSVYEITSAVAEKRRKVGRAHNLFGKPEALERFNALAAKVAAETGSDYLDVYTPTKQHPDKPILFTGDGVHLSNEGNRLIALEILKYFSAEK